MSDEQGNSRNARKPFDDPRSAAIIGAAIEAHRTLGTGYLEKVYHCALERELSDAGIPFRSEVEVPICYKGEFLPVGYRADMICYDDILIELKAMREFGPTEDAQVINYLVAGQIPVGLLLNFGEMPLGIRRYVGPMSFKPRSGSVP